MKNYKDITGDGGSQILQQVAEQSARLKSRLKSVKHTIAVLSGKGGVGKSAVTVNLAAALALKNYRTGILDSDINGPSVAKMTGVRNQTLQQSDGSISPAQAAFGLKIMSIDLFLADDKSPVTWQAPVQRDAYTWRGMMEMAVLRELLTDTEWGELDFLFLDLPPGADKISNLIDLLPDFSGIIIVTIPSEVSRFVVGKSIQLAREILKAPVIGLVENMSHYVCSHCGKEEPLFPSAQPQTLTEEFGIPLLGRIPFDPHLSAALDAGIPYLEKFPGLPAAKIFGGVAEKIKKFIE